MHGVWRFRLLAPLVAASIAMALGASCAGDEGSSGAGSDSSEASDDVETVALTELSTGDCFDGLQLQDADQTIAETVERVSCRAAHDHEVFHAFEFGDDEPYPGDLELVGLAEDGCADAFVDRVGNPDALDQISIWPSSTSWRAGDRAVLCAVFARDGDQLVGTIR